MIAFFLEAAARSLLLALTVALVLRLARNRTTAVERLAWALVLAAACLMPVVMPLATPLAMRVAIRLPVSLPAVQLPLAELPLAGLMHFTSDALPTPPQPLNLTRVPAADAASTRPISVAHSRAGSLAMTTQPLAAAALSKSQYRQQARQQANLAQPSLAQPDLAQPSPVRPNPAQQGLAEPGLATLANGPLERLTAARFSIRRCITAAYLAIVAWLLARLAAGLFLGWRLWLRAQPVVLPGAEDLSIRASHEVSSPVTFASSILLPADFASWSPETLRLVLAHESAHLRQRDFWWQLLAAAHAAVFWFSPLGWWLCRRLAELAEALSDRAAIAIAADPAAYAELLLAFAARPQRLAVKPAVAMASRTSITARIERILNSKGIDMTDQPSSLPRLRALLLTTAVVTLFASVALLRPQSAHAIALQSQTGAAPITSTAGPIPHDVRLLMAAPQAAGQMTPSSVVVHFAPIKLDYQANASPTSSSANPASPPQNIVLVRPASPAPPSTTDISISPAPQPPTTVLLLPSSSATPQSIALSMPAIKLIAPMSAGDWWWSSGHAVLVDGDKGDKALAAIGAMSADDIARLKREHPGKFIYFLRGGKSYVIDDPKTVAQAESLFEFPQLPQIKVDQAKINAQMAQLAQQMKQIDSVKLVAAVETPAFKQQMADLNRQLSQLASSKADLLLKQNKIASDPAASAKLEQQMYDLEGKMGRVQGEIGRLQGQLGRKMGEIGVQQGDLGAKMGALGAKLGDIGLIDGEHGREAGDKFNSLIDQAMTSGEAKPLN